MEIFRESESADWTRIPNASIQDRRLSMRALGLLTFLLSLPPSQNIDLRDIAKNETPEGYAAVQAAMQELIDAGHVRE